MALNFPIETDERYEGRISFKAINSTSAAGQVSAASGGGDVGLQQAVGNTQVQVSGGSVNLYLPQGVTINDAVGYENTDLGLIGSGIAFAAKDIYEGGGTKGLQTLTDPAQSLADKVMSNLFGPESKAIGAALAEGFIGSAVAAGTGITANPHRRSIFRDVALRQFAFNFIMIPASEAEAAASEDIVKFFRLNLYPEKLGGGAAYKFPTKFEIQFTYKGEQVANKLLPCYLTSVSTQYNPRSGSFHYDSRFSEIGISLAFQEETTLSREDIVDGF